MRLVYVGDHVYAATSTLLGPIYERGYDGALLRSDWGKVSLALAMGENIVITQATRDQREYIYAKGDELIEKAAYTGRDRWVWGLGNFEAGTIPDEEVDAAVAAAKERMRS